MQNKNTIFGNAIVWEDEDGSKNMWFLEHYMKVYRYYKQQNFQRYDTKYGIIENHPLEGKRIIFPDDDKECYVESVYKHWDKGFMNRYCIIVFQKHSLNYCVQIS